MHSVEDPRTQGAQGRGERPIRPPDNGADMVEIAVLAAPSAWQGVDGQEAERRIFRRWQAGGAADGVGFGKAVQYVCAQT